MENIGPKNIGVIGAGAWGTALSHALGNGGNSVQLWALEQDVVDSINNRHENERYLKGFKLSENVTASTDIKKVAADKEFLILASPSLFLASTVKKILDVPSIKDGSCFFAEYKYVLIIKEINNPNIVLNTFFIFLNNRVGGKKASHHAPLDMYRMASESIMPMAGCSGGIPKPKKVNPDSCMIACGKRRISPTKN